MSDISSNSVIALGITSYLVMILKDIPSKFIKYLQQYIGYSFTVTSVNEIAYRGTMEWIFSLGSKSVAKHTNLENYDDNSIITLDYGTFFVFTKHSLVKIVKEEIKEKNYLINKITITIFSFTSFLFDNLSIQLKDLSDVDKLCVHPNKSSWEKQRVEKRYFSSIFIPKDSMYELRSGIDKWNNVTTKELYKSMGITYKLGVLLYGLPGTGKTSLCKAIASELGYELHIISLNSYENEEELISRIVKVKKKSVILFEDIDCYHNIVRGREEVAKNAKAITLSTLLNIFDGVISPEGVIFIATTNHIDKIDPALLRSGRFDIKIQLENLSVEDSKAMCDYWRVSNDCLEKEEFPINPAYLQSLIFGMRT
jgi:broad-specificity NMP kinase